MLPALLIFAAALQGVRVERFDSNPLLSVENVTRNTAQNLDRPGDAPLFVSFAGPSVIRIPEWIPDAPGSASSCTSTVRALARISTSGPSSRPPPMRADSKWLPRRTSATRTSAFSGTAASRIPQRASAPERIRLHTLRLDDPARPGLGLDWSRWSLSAAREVLFPLASYEQEPAPRTLDPNVFFDDDGRAYLFYSGRHEQTIAGIGAEPWLGSRATITALPSALTGAIAIQTDVGDVRSHAASEWFMRFEVSHPATVTVAHDTATLGRPAWLAGWAQTGETLQLYGRDYEPGEVALGGNLPRDAPFPLDGAMHSVFVSPSYP